MRTKTICLLGLIAIIAACKSSEIRVVHVGESKEFEDNYQVYALPKTVVYITIQVTKTVMEPGPYYQYSKKYVGIEDVIKKRTETWRISDIRFDYYAEPDADHFYLVHSKKMPITNCLTLTPEGLIAGINVASPIVPEEPALKPYLHLTPVANDILPFTDLSIKKYISKEDKTLYKRVIQDSVSVRVPVTNQTVDQKTIEEKAEEAADFIFKLRKRHFKLLAGVADEYPNNAGMINDKFPDGESVKFMHEKLEELESNYLDLFIGRTATTVVEYYFQYTPDNEPTASLDLCRFSTVAGIIASTEKEGEPITIRATKTGHTQKLKDDLLLKKPTEAKDDCGFFYRVPEYGSIELILGKHEIARQQILIAQFGVINSLPVEFLKDNHFQVLFYPELGAIKQIAIIKN